MPRFKIIGLLVIEKIFEGFYHIWAWRPYWSCDRNHLFKHSFPLGRAVSEKMFENNDIHVYSPVAGTDPGAILFNNSIIQSSQYIPLLQVCPHLMTL